MLVFAPDQVYSNWFAVRAICPVASCSVGWEPLGIEYTNNRPSIREQHLRWSLALSGDRERCHWYPGGDRTDWGIDL